MSKFLNTIDVYLSGPITHVETTWRSEMAEELEKVGRGNSICVNVYIPKESSDESDHFIIERDLQAIERSDIVISYIFSETFGSSMEIFYSYRILRKPTYVICPYRKISPWLTGNSTKLYKTLNGFYSFFDSWLRETYLEAD